MPSPRGKGLASRRGRRDRGLSSWPFSELDERVQRVPDLLRPGERIVVVLHLLVVEKRGRGHALHHGQPVGDAADRTLLVEVDVFVRLEVVVAQKTFETEGRSRRDPDR